MDLPFLSGCNKAMLVKIEISILLLQPGKSSGPKWIYINFGARILDLLLGKYFWESIYQVSETLGLFYHLIVLVLGKKSVKGLRVTKNVKAIKIEGVWSKLEANKSFHRQ